MWRPADLKIPQAAWACLLVIVSAWLSSSCSPPPPAKRYTFDGQILAVLTARQQLTIKTGDIAGLMPAMTMTYDVGPAALMTPRTAGETISGTLEVTDAGAKIVAITHTGTAPLPPANELAMATTDVLKEGDAVPDTALIDQHNVRRSLSDWHGTYLLLTFIYTSCPLPNFCPLMDQNFATIQRALANDAALKAQVRLLSISFDPDHDTPAVLDAHAKRERADPAVWTYATGDQVAIDRLTARFGVTVMRPDAGTGTITHGLRTALISPDGHVLKIYDGNDWTPGQVLTDLRAAMSAK
jgi:protein SCO1/2